MARAIRAYRIRVYQPNADPAVDEPITSGSGGADWSRDSQIGAPGFTTTCTINLQELWTQLFESGASRIEGFATGYELIVKFGKTMDWRASFRVIIEIE